MLALVATQIPDAPLEIRTVDDHEAAGDEALIWVHAFSLNRGELALAAMRPEGWRSGQDIARVVARQVRDGSSPSGGKAG